MSRQEVLLDFFGDREWPAIIGYDYPDLVYAHILKTGELGVCFEGGRYFKVKDMTTISSMPVYRISGEGVIAGFTSFDGFLYLTRNYET